VIVALCLSPFVIGGMGIARGPAQYGAVLTGDAGKLRDLASHYRYLSGIFFAVGLMALSCVPRIERMGDRFRWVVILVVTGGFARLAGIAIDGAPSAGHLIGLATELGITPLLGLWQARVARRFA
jgi:hypothetical protein